MTTRTLPLFNTPVVGTDKLSLWPHQLDAVDAIAREHGRGIKRVMVAAPTGSGKCHPAGTKILKWNGTVVSVENVTPGTLLMGPDSQPREVMSISSGYGPIYEIVPNRGESWRCNEDHVLTLVCNYGSHKGEVVDVSLRDWMSWSKYRKHVYKLFHAGVDFPESARKPLQIDPYLLGLLIGDGSLKERVRITTADEEIAEYCRHAAESWGLRLVLYNKPSRATNYSFSGPVGGRRENPLMETIRRMGLREGSEAKFIPDRYLVASRKDRLALLAGLIDTDGSLDGSVGFRYYSISRWLCDGVSFLARSLGFAVTVSRYKIKDSGFNGRPCWVLCISGPCHLVPTKLPRKQAQEVKRRKNVLRTGFGVRPVGDDRYYGFTLSGDGRYLLSDFTVTHNTEASIYVVHRARKRGMKVAFVADSLNLVDQTSKRFAKYGIDHGVVQANNTRGRGLPVQICSAQTIEKRGFFPDLDMLIIDEAHIKRGKILEFMKNWNGLVIGLSATPITEGLGLHYQSVINACTTDYLLKTVNPDTGKPYLAPLQVMAAVEADMLGAKTGAGGEWLSSEVQKRGRPIIGDIVSNWEKYTLQSFGGPVKTLLFSASIPHGEELCGAFQGAGYDFRQSTYHDSYEDTQEIVESHMSGEFTGLVSVSRFVKGHDDPGVKCIVDARPNRSLAEVVQKAGRGMRSAPGKDYCIEGSQRVLTKRGLVRIDHIECDDLLWDGVEWVRHGGLVYKGHKEIITYAGLTATPDHKVYTRQGWETFGEASRHQRDIVQTGVGGYTIRHSEDHFRRGGNASSQGGGLSKSLREVRVSRLWPYIHDHVDQLEEGSDERLPILQSASTSVSGMAVQAMCFNEAEMHELQRPKLGQLWRKGYRVSLWHSQGCCSVGHGESGCSSSAPLVESGQDRQRGPLRAWEPSLESSRSSTGQQAAGGYASLSQVQDESSRSTVCRCFSPKDDVRGSVRRGNNRAVESTVLQAEGEVWDILNAGPRNRFTVEGLLVHNCLYLDCAGNFPGHYDEILDLWTNGVDVLDNGSNTKQKDYRKEGEERKDVVCSCGFVLMPEMTGCPSCGEPRRKRKKPKVETRPGRMVDITRPMRPPPWLEDEKWVWQQVCRMAVDEASGDQKAARKKASGSYKGLYGSWPKWGRPLEPAAGPVDERVRRRVKANRIRYFQGKK